MPDLSRRRYLQAGGIATATALAGCLGGDSGVDNELTLATTVPEGFAYNIYAEEFDNLLREESDGEFGVDLRTDGVFGSEPEQTETLQTGEIDMIVQGLGVTPALTADSPVIRSINATWVYEPDTSWEHMLNIIEAIDERADLFGTYADAGLTTLGLPVFAGDRHVTANKPIREPADAEGVSIRVPTVPGWPEGFSAAGFQPQSIEFPEVYSSLETGVVEAAEGESSLMLNINVDEVQSHYSRTFHYPNGGWHHVNTDYFNGLDESTQEMMRTLADEARQNVESDVRDGLSEDQDELDMEVIDDVALDELKDLVWPNLREAFNNSETVLGFDEIIDLQP